ncbi:MAG: lysylphosphatidylglycerol synthase transmembrane domain-containing protein [Myxococcota bacterium]
MIKAWKALPETLRRYVVLTAKAGLTIGAFYLLFTHEIPAGDGRKILIWDSIVENMASITWAVFIPFILAATAIKFVGIFSSMVRWHLLLIGQGIRFNFWHVVGSFLIGRFLGTFLPSTVGLDSYKLYDAAKFSGRVVEPAAATAVEKVMGLSGLFLCFLIALPFGYPILYDVLGDGAGMTIVLTIGIAFVIVVGLFMTLFKPGIVEMMLGLLPAFGRKRLQGFLRRVSQSATAYRGKAGILVAVSILSFSVHFTTAVMYFFTALAIGAVGAEFWQVTFASSIQIFATVLSPFTIAGEGIREIAQTWLLQSRIGAGHAVLSAALGFWAAEAMTLVGAFFLWGRPADYKPSTMVLDERLVEPAPPAGAAGAEDVGPEASSSARVEVREAS